MNKLPISPGIKKPKRFYQDMDDGPPIKQLKEGGYLSDIKKDYELFTYAPLFIYDGTLQHNPVQEWINLKNISRPIVYILKLNEQIIKTDKIPNKFDTILWAVEKEFWGGLSFHIGSIAIMNRLSKFYAKVLCQQIVTKDVTTKLDNIIIDKPPTKIYTFSWDSNKYLEYFEVPMNGNLPYLNRTDPREETIKFANALFNELSEPYEAIGK